MESKSMEDSVEQELSKFVNKQTRLLQLENQEELKRVRAGKISLKLIDCKELDNKVKQVVFKRTDTFFGSQVAGFNIGDSVLCTKICTHEIHKTISEVKGIIIGIDKEAIIVCFQSRDWCIFESNSHDVRYFLSDHYDEFTYKTMLSAVTKLHFHKESKLVKILFDQDNAWKLLMEEDQSSFNTLSFVNKKLSEDQKLAVSVALKRKNMAIIQGPPGTGKTTTLIEIINQLVKEDKRVLVCAPTNVAVDNLVVKAAQSGLKPLRIGNVMRISKEAQPYSFTRVSSQHPDFTNSNNMLKRLVVDPETGAYDILEEYKEKKSNLATKTFRHYRAVFGTLSMATVDEGILKHVERRFDVVIIDEASQALEASCWIAIPNAPKLILAGDIHQLSPMVSSQEAKLQGLGVSLMERAIAKLGKVSYVSLKTQFRMNQKIMAWSNKHFYNGNLVAHSSVKDKVLSDLYDVIGTAITKESVMLIDTNGCGDRCKEFTSSGTSQGNIGEAIIVAKVVNDLVYRCDVLPSSIGVITPYQLQSQFIQKLLNKLSRVEVSTVDGFQGREKEVIVLSFVRSNAQKSLGFVKDERRLNVAVTRAKKLLVLVADSTTISSSPIINDLLKHIELVGRYESGKSYLSDEADVRAKYTQLENFAKSGKKTKW